MNTHRDLSAVARSAKVDQLDEAIDHVASRMTHVEESDAFAAQVVSALPERSRHGWLFHSWAPRLAITAGLAALAITVVLRTFDDGSTDVLRSAVLGSPAVEFATAALENRTNVEPTSTVRRTPVERPENDRRTALTDAPDFDRSLPAIAAMKSLTIEALAPTRLTEDAPLTLAPLAIADLPLTAESISPR